MKHTIDNILFNISMFIACEEEKVSYHRVGARMYRRKDRCIRICGIPFKQYFVTEWVD